MNVRLVGCGFLGSLFAEELAKWSFGLHEELAIDLFDNDKVEERNIANQLYNVPGMPKAHALRSRLESYPNVHPFARVKRVDEQVMKQFVEEGADVIVCAVDNIETRQLMWSRALVNTVPLLNIGVAQGGTGAVDWTYFPGNIDTNPFGLTQGHTEEQLKKYANLNQSLPPCELIGFRGLGLNMAVAATQAVMILTGWDPLMHVHKAKGRKAPWGTFTTWQADLSSHKLLQVLQTKEEE